MHTTSQALNEPFAHYSVTNDGRVINTVRWRVLKQSNDSRGYPMVVLCNNNYRRTVNVHKLVCSAYYGECPEGYVCDHIDRNKQNNNVENLRYVTRADNNKNRQVRGTVSKRKNRNLWITLYPVLNQDNTVTRYCKYHKTIEDAQTDLERMQLLHGNRVLTFGS